MKLYGVTAEQLQKIMGKVSRKQYKGNLEFVYLESHNNHVQFTLRVKDSHGLGARRSQHNRHAMVSACWHAHRDLMREIFSQFPVARLVSAQAVYRGQDGFKQEFERTGDRNIGSVVQPVYYREACECGWGRA